MFLDSTERRIWQTLRAVGRQRVCLILQPGNIWVIDRAKTAETDDDLADLQTCQMRGWIEPLHEAVPSGKLTPDGKLPHQLFDGMKTVYRLTDSGWSVVNRSQALAILGFVVSGFSLAVSILALFIATGR